MTEKNLALYNFETWGTLRFCRGQAQQWADSGKKLMLAGNWSAFHIVSIILHIDA